MAVKQATPAKLSRREEPGALALAVPPLEAGDRLTRQEFERRYAAMAHVKKAELIEGVVYMPSPIRYESHAKPHILITTWLGTYLAATPGVGAADNATVRLDLDNVVQPDALLWLERGGAVRVSEDDFLEGAPELIVEIAGSSAAYDLHDKLRVYRRNGVPEYIVWQVYDERVDWFELRDEEYTPLPADEQGLVSSRAFPGLRLAVPGLLKGDLAAVLAAQQEALGTPDHAAFAQQIAAR